MRGAPEPRLDARGAPGRAGELPVWTSHVRVDGGVRARGPGPAQLARGRLRSALAQRPGHQLQSRLDRGDRRALPRPGRPAEQRWRPRRGARRYRPRAHRGRARRLAGELPARGLVRLDAPSCGPAPPAREAGSRGAPHGRGRARRNAARLRGPRGGRAADRRGKREGEPRRPNLSRRRPRPPAAAPAAGSGGSARRSSWSGGSRRWRAGG